LLCTVCAFECSPFRPVALYCLCLRMLSVPTSCSVLSVPSNALRSDQLLCTVFNWSPCSPQQNLFRKWSIAIKTKNVLQTSYFCVCYSEHLLPLTDSIAALTSQSVCLCVSICVLVCVSVCVCMSVCLCLPACLSVCVSVCPYVCVSVCFYMSVCLSVFCASVCLSVRLFLCVSICMSVCLHVCLCVCLSVCLSASRVKLI
jgi:hypothetical protein